MIELKNIKKYYKMGDDIVKALDGINLKIEDGEFVTIIGPSGSGKSTMMNIVGCLDKATEGEYFVDGVEISKFSENQLAFLRNKKMGFIFQGFNLLKDLTAYGNVELPLIYQGVPKAERKRRVLNALEMVGMLERIKHKPNELSGGQQQRVAIARALATQPMCILADEPTGNLDSSTGAEIMKILKKLNKHGTTVVIITHNNEIASLSRRVVRIYDGKIESDTINEEILSYDNSTNDTEEGDELLTQSSDSALSQNNLISENGSTSENNSNLKIDSQHLNHSPSSENCEVLDSQNYELHKNINDSLNTNYSDNFNANNMDASRIAQNSAPQNYNSQNSISQNSNSQSPKTSGLFGFLDGARIRIKSKKTIAKENIINNQEQSQKVDYIDNNDTRGES